jgi:hypothetical protein
MVKTAVGVVWRASLETPSPGSRISFTDLEALFTYLETATRNASPVEAVHSEREEE